MKGPVYPLLFIVLAGCGSARPPQSLVQLEALVARQAGAAGVEAAQVTWEEGVRLLEEARDLAKKGKTAAAGRVAAIGVIRIRTALALARGDTVRQRLKETELELQQVEDEIEKFGSYVEHLEKEIERERIRVHLGQVVNETRRRAAAQEEIGVRNLGLKQQEELAQAHQQVGQEMVARTRVWVQVVTSLHRADLASEGQLRFVEGAAELSQAALKNKDLAAVQEYVEQTGVEARRVLDEAWGYKAESEAQRLGVLAQELSSQGWRATTEEFGLTIGFPLRLRAGKKRRRGWETELADLGRTLAELDRLGVVVLASSGTHDFPDPAAGKNSTALALKGAEALGRGGLSPTLVVSSGCGPAAPLIALRQGHERIAVLLVPLPQSR